MTPIISCISWITWRGILSLNPERCFKTLLLFSHPHLFHPACVSENLSYVLILKPVPQVAYISEVLFQSLSPIPLPSYSFYTFLQFFFSQKKSMNKTARPLPLDGDEEKLGAQWEDIWADGSGRWAVDAWMEEDVTFHSRGGLGKNWCKNSS